MTPRFRIAAYIGVVAAMAVGLYTTQERTASLLRQNQLAACARGNVLRDSIRVDHSVLDAFLATAQKARQDSADEYKKVGDVEQQKLNQAAANVYKIQRARLRAVQKIDCKAVIR